MPTELSLLERMDAEIAAARQKIADQQKERVNQYQQRQQRLATLEKTLDELRDLWRPPLEALASRFADRVKVTPTIDIGSRRATFEFQSELARINLRFSAVTDDDVRNIIFLYDLEILPILMKFDSHKELRFPLASVDRAALSRWIDDQIINFVKTYLSLHDISYYLQDHLVEDPIAKVKFPKFAAAAKLERKGKTIYFIGEETRREFEQQESAKPE